MLMFLFFPDKMTPFVRSLSNLNNPSNVKGVEKGKGGVGGE
jgi:hypothetical protein